jgi:hypothetical protein
MMIDRDAGALAIGRRASRPPILLTNRPIAVGALRISANGGNFFLRSASFLGIFRGMFGLEDSSGLRQFDRELEKLV